MSERADNSVSHVTAREQANAILTSQFFGALFPPTLGGFIEVRALPSKARAFLPFVAPERMNEFIFGHRSENLYFGVATRRTAANGTLANCGELAALFVDVDFKSTPEAEARQWLADFPLSPSIRIGSGGGLHVYWVLENPLCLYLEAERARVLLRRLAVRVSGDLRSAEPAHVLRVPGTLNWKYQPPRHVTVESFENDRRYSIADFERTLPAEPVRRLRGGRFVVPEKIIDGERNATLYRLARVLHSRQLSASVISVVLKTVNAQLCQPPLSGTEVDDIAARAVTQPDRPSFRRVKLHVRRRYASPRIVPSRGTADRIKVILG